MSTEPRHFSGSGPLPSGLTALQASAGTGKTYALSSLAARFVAEAGVSAAQLCVVSFTEAATAELRGRVRSRLVQALAYLEQRAVIDADDEVLQTIAAADGPELAARADRLRLAIAEFDAATITTIHGFCSRVLGGAAASGDAAITDGAVDVEEVVNDLLVARLSHQPRDKIIPKRVLSAVRTRLALPDAMLWRGDPPAGKPKGNESVDRDNTEFVAALIDDAHHEVIRRRLAARRRTFDGLLVDVRELLTSSAGASTVKALRDRYRLVLIDEFQDTDSVQWDVFRTAFVDAIPGSPVATTVVLVGDPKQSIYRFRGAELSAYLEAVAQAQHVSTLATNWRSDQPLLTALEVLFDGFTFGSPQVAFEPVGAAPDRHQLALHGAGSESMQVRWVPTPVDGLLTAPRAHAAVMSDVAAVVAELLAGTVTLADSPGGTRQLRASDIAILTRSNRQALALAQTLGEAGLAAATASNDSVLDSEAARQWALLLNALERPGSVGAARAAALGWFIGCSPAQLDVFDDQRQAELHELLRSWAGALARRGVPQLLGLARAHGLHRRLLAYVGGERHLTDLEHVAELMQVATGSDGASGGVSAAALLAVLEEAGQADVGVANDRLARRIDRDDEAVQILTVHKAKGLEFPVVLCPFLWGAAAGGSSMPHASIEGQRWLDTTWAADVPNRAWNSSRRDIAKQEAEGELRRQLYVALTRAKHRVVLWWAPLTKPSGASLASLFQSALGSADPPADPHELDQLVAAGAGSLQVEVVQLPRALPTHVASEVQRMPLEVSSSSFSVDSSWRRWSFSSIKSEGEIQAEAEVGEAARSAADAPVAGGSDESGPEGPSPDFVSRPRGPADAAPPGPLARVPGGTDFGTLVHGVLERCDFASVTLLDDLQVLCTDALRYRRLAVTPEVLAQGLHRAIEAPLGGPEGGLRLRDLARGNRLDELAFDLPLGSLQAGRIGEVLAAHLPVDDLLHGWAVGLAANGFAFDVAGMLNGSIDLVARTDHGRRFWVADYKTNQLGPDSEYTRGEMAQAMRHHQYPLQAALYLVALHRYLRWRLPDYHPEQHLGGAAYLFVRGMDPVRGPLDTRGVFWWHPPARAVLALDELLAGKDAATTGGVAT